MIIRTPMCIYCKHFIADELAKDTCKAYPKRIPDDIWGGLTRHFEPREDDNGIQFEPLEGYEHIFPVPEKEPAEEGAEMEVSDDPFFEAFPLPVESTPLPKE